MTKKVILTRKESPILNGSVWIIGNMAMTEQQLLNIGYTYNHKENAWYKETTLQNILT